MAQLENMYKAGSTTAADRSWQFHMGRNSRARKLLLTNGADLGVALKATVNARNFGAADILAADMPDHLPAAINSQLNTPGKMWLLAGRQSTSVRVPTRFRGSVIQIVAGFNKDTQSTLLGQLDRDDRVAFLAQSVTSGLASLSGVEGVMPRVDPNPKSVKEMVLEHICLVHLFPSAATEEQDPEDETDTAQHPLDMLSKDDRLEVQQHIAARCTEDERHQDYFYREIMSEPGSPGHTFAVQIAKANQKMLDIQRLLLALDTRAPEDSESTGAVMSSVLGTGSNAVAGYVRAMVNSFGPWGVALQLASWLDPAAALLVWREVANHEAEAAAVALLPPDAAHDAAKFASHLLLALFPKSAEHKRSANRSTDGSPATMGSLSRGFKRLNRGSVYGAFTDVADDAIGEEGDQEQVALVDYGKVQALFGEDGAPQPVIFVGNANLTVKPGRLALVAAAVRHMLDVRVQYSLGPDNADKVRTQTALEYTASIDKHLQRYLDTPMGLLQTSSKLGSAVMPHWYVTAVVQPAVNALHHRLELCRQRGLGDEAFIESCQAEAGKSLKEDAKLYAVAKNKAEASSKTESALLKVEAAKKEGEVRQNWAKDPETGRPQRPAQPSMGSDASIADVMLQAVQSQAEFCEVIYAIGKSSGFRQDGDHWRGLKMTMVRGSLDPTTKLLAKYKGSDADAPADLLWMLKAAYRMAQKDWVRGNANTICDVNRALAVAYTIEDMLEGIKAVFANNQIEVVDVKDRVNKPTSGGWSDFVLLFRVKRGEGTRSADSNSGDGGGVTGHINELQIALHGMMVARSGMNAHEAYAVARYFVEMLLKCDREYDATSEEQRLQQINDIQTKAIEALKLQIDQLQQDVVKLPTKKGWLHIKTGKKIWKRRWFVLKNGCLTYHKKDEEWLRAESPLLSDLIDRAKGWMHGCTVQGEAHPTDTRLGPPGPGAYTGRLNAVTFVVTDERGCSLTVSTEPSTPSVKDVIVAKQWMGAISSISGAQPPLDFAAEHVTAEAAPNTEV